MVDEWGESRYHRHMWGNVSLARGLMFSKDGCRTGCLLESGGMDNHSKILKLELGQQIPVKSPFKMKQDMVKRARSSMPIKLEKTEFDSCCWFNKKVSIVRGYRECGPLEFSLPNSRIGFFDECVTQKFHMRNPCTNSTMEHADYAGPIPDAYTITNSYQSHCMDLSKELMTFAIGGPRFFENNTLF